MLHLTPPCRLFVLFARDAPRAVIFRRGPSKNVRLISWHTNIDRFDNGQWFKGSVYPERCDLSPTGEYLVYFAGKYKRWPNTWTAVSRPPYWTALSFWGHGDAWLGGGRFVDDRTLHLNERFAVFDNERPTPPWLMVESTTHFSVFAYGFLGWTLTQEVKLEERPKPWRGPIREPAVWKLPHPDGVTYLRLIQGFPGEDWWKNRTDRVTLHRAGSEPEPLVAEQVHFDQQGRLIVVQAGQVLASSITPGEALRFKVLADFNDQTFEEIRAPEWATRWGNAPPE